MGIFGGLHYIERIKFHYNVGFPNGILNNIQLGILFDIANRDISIDIDIYYYFSVMRTLLARANPTPRHLGVFRNVKDFGAKGDGVTDDTAAINNAISSGGRCGPGCASSSTTLAIVYFPSGTYLISSSIIDFYYTQLIGNPNCPPALKATPGLKGLGLIDGDPYQPGGNLAWGATNVFWRQIRNFVLDMTAIPPSIGAKGIHWPTAQATNLQNIVFNMSDAPGTQHVGLFIEGGSGGVMNDLVFYGGFKAASIGNQQFTMRNITFHNSVTAIDQLWDWGWTYKSISINNCTLGINITNGGPTAQSVGSVALFDSSIANTPVGISTAHSITQAMTNGTIVLENVSLDNVPVAVQGLSSSTILAGSAGSTNITGWGQGHSYTPLGPTNFQGSIIPFRRPTSLLSSGAYYERSKPQYGAYSYLSFRSTRDAGAKGDGITDDTAALQSVINCAAENGQIVFFDAGTYKITDTLNIPQGSKLVGESYPVIMSSGEAFADVTNPKAVVSVGMPGEQGQVEWSDIIVSTQGAQAGAILIEWNLSTDPTSPSGMWDVHTRVGGFAGSNLQVANCPTTPNTTATASSVVQSCIAAFMLMHITPSASGLYMENVWLWTADHDIEDTDLKQITVYSGRGLYVESTAGNIWLVGTAVEHNALYQYQFANTKSIFMGQIQTETPYYQPNPNAVLPFTPNSKYGDPDFATSCAGKAGNCAMAWGLRIVDTTDIVTYGAGIYSFFNNYQNTCSGFGAGGCQNSIVSLEGFNLHNIGIYGLNTIGSVSMVDRGGTSLASAADNIDVFPDTIAVFQMF